MEAPLSRRFDELKILILNIDGGVFGEHTMIGAVGVGGVSLGGGQPARRTGGALYRQPVWRAALATALPGDHQYHRKPTRRSAHPNPPGNKLAEWLDGATLDGFGFSENGEGLPQDHGLSRTLDVGGDSERIAGRHTTGRGVVTSTQPPLATFNYARDILRETEDWYVKRVCILEPMP